MTAINSSITLLLLVFLVFFAYQTYRVDKFRQDLFLIRDELFDAALNQEVSFDDRGYILTRQLINGMIRFGHRLSVLNFIVFGICFAKTDLTKFRKDTLNEWLRNASPEGRDVFEKYSSRVHVRVLEHITTSPIFIATKLVPVVITLLAKVGVDVMEIVLKNTKHSFSVLDRTAVAQGA